MDVTSFYLSSDWSLVNQSWAWVSLTNQNSFFHEILCPFLSVHGQDSQNKYPIFAYRFYFLYPYSIILMSFPFITKMKPTRPPMNDHNPIKSSQYSAKLYKVIWHTCVLTNFITLYSFDHNMIEKWNKKIWKDFIFKLNRSKNNIWIDRGIFN